MNKHFIIIYAILLYIIYKLNSNKNIEHMSATSGNISAAALNKLNTFLSDINGTLTVKNLKVLGNTDITGKTTIGGDTNIGGKTVIGSNLLVNTQKKATNNALEIYLNKPGNPEYYYFHKNNCGIYKNNTGNVSMNVKNINTDYARINRLDIPGQGGTTHFNHTDGKNYINNDTYINGNVGGNNNVITNNSFFKFKANYHSDHYVGGSNDNNNLNSNNANGYGKNKFIIEKH